MSAFKFEIGCKEFTYNHLDYIVDVRDSHAVCWKVLSLGTQPHLETGMRSSTEVDESPAGAIIWAHESARAWIDNYVETHLILQDAVEAAQSKYGDNR